MTEPNKKEQLTQQIARIEVEIQKVQDSINSQAARLRQTAAHLYQLRQRQIRLEQELQLLDTDTVYVHLMSNYKTHRTIRIMKGTQPAHHLKIRFFFTIGSKVIVETNGVRIPLQLEQPQWFETREGTYMATLFLTRAEVHHSITKMERS